MWSQLWTSSARSLTVWPQARHQAATVFLQTSSNTARPPYCTPLHEVLCQCWREGAVPQDMRDAKIITLYKNKGERSDCNNYRVISLLSIVGKVHAQVLLICLQKLAEHVYPESQCGFQAERSMVDMVFSLHQLQEKCRV